PDEYGGAPTTVRLEANPSRWSDQKHGGQADHRRPRPTSRLLLAAFMRLQTLVRRLGCGPPQPHFEVPGDKTGTIGRRHEVTRFSDARRKVDQLPDARRSGRPLLFQLTSSPLLSSSS